MTVQRVADMTVEELKALIAQEIERRLRVWPHPYDPRTPQEILKSIQRNRWTPPAGTPSALEMLREDRER
jgi:hypothetical protein